jgi:hypothetical protein
VFLTGSRENRCGNGGAEAILLLFPTQNQKTRKEVGRCAASSPLSFHDHSALELKTAFMIILGLENAELSLPSFR